MKDRIVFDVSDVDTIAASDSVGAYLRSADGTLLTHTDVGGKKALDVRVAEGINVEVDLDFADDSVDVTGSDVTVSNTVTVSATNFDIRDLVFATDKVDVTGSAVSVTGTVAVTQSTSPWVVSATDLDIRNLVFATDKVDVSGSAVSVTGTVTVTDAALANTAAANSAVAINTTAGGVSLGTPLANRKYLLVQNLGNQAIYLGQGTVTAANGFRISPSAVLELRAGAAQALKAIANAGSQDTRILELS